MQITANILYVNPPKPGGNPKYGSIKLDHQVVQRVSVPAARLHEFERGKAYTIDVKQTEAGFYNFVEIISAMKPQAQQTGISPRAQSYARGSTGTSDRMIFITGVVGRGMGSGKFTADQIKLLAMYASDAYEAVSSPQPRLPVRPSEVYQPRRDNGRSGGEPAGPRYDVPDIGDEPDDMNDPIPF